MDGLIALICFALFFALVIVPIMALVALRRSGSAEEEIALLRQRITALEQGHFSSAPAPDVAENVEVEQADAQFEQAEEMEAVYDEPPLPPAQLARNDAYVPVEPSPAPVDLWRNTRHVAAQPAAAVSHSEASPEQEKSPVSGVISSLVRWFIQGNPMAKLGIILLFLGIAFLLRYTVERSLFPLELRLVAAALGSVALLVFGWRLRHKQPVYALILQGGATGALYLTIFGAFRLWQMLPMSLAFVLLIVVCAASVALAVLQRTLSLAMLASLGGYLAPVLLSTGGGSHVGLFSFYILLSVGILAISVWQHWRELNLLGMLFTFGIGGIWGMNGYRPEFYLSCQLFLIANIFLFGMLSVALSLRAQKSGKRIIDAVLFFAPPLVGFGMQYSITQYFAWGPALSALGFGFTYLALGWLAIRRFPSAGNMLVLAALVMGGVFATLTIPLALSARWTAIGWTLEGLGILWFGVIQHQRRLADSGTGLLVLAAISALMASGEGMGTLSLAVVFAVLSLAWFAAAWLWRSLQQSVTHPLLIGALVFWLVAAAAASLLVTPTHRAAGYSLLALLSLSVWLWRYASIRLRWSELGYAQWLLWPAIALALVCQLIEQRHFLSLDWQNLVWCLALPSALALLRCEDRKTKADSSYVQHLSLFWMILLALGAEYYWFIGSFGWGTQAWRAGLTMVVGALLILLVQVASRHKVWPFRKYPMLYNTLGVAPVLPVLLVLVLFANLLDGAVFQQLYLPLINPLEEGAALALFGLVYYSRNLLQHVPSLRIYQRQLLLTLAALAFWWVNGLLLRALAAFGDVAWYAESLWHSRLVQTSFALFWTLISLVTMLYATRHGLRKAWMGGAVLLGVAIAKLMLVDSATGGGLARAIAFIGVAVLVLIVGYFSPLPPKAQLALQKEDDSEME